MSSDIRISVEFWKHPKTGRLIRDVGLEGVRSLQILWCWVATNKPDGILSGMDDLDVEFSADWRGKPGVFFAAIDGRWIDAVDGVLSIHDWAEHNPWAAESDERSDMARMSRLSREKKEAAEFLKERGITKISKEEYQIYKRSTNVEQTYCERIAIRTTPAPAPAPVYMQQPNQDKKKLYVPEIPSNTRETPQCGTENDGMAVLNDGCPF